jgi:hypothetical protein
MMGGDITVASEPGKGSVRVRLPGGARMQDELFDSRDCGFSLWLTCFPVFGPIIAGKFQFSGMSGRWTRTDHEEIEVHGGADCLHPAAG